MNLLLFREYYIRDRVELDLEVAYDGDGARLGVIGPGGEIICGDQPLILFARSILPHHPGATVIGEVKFPSVCTMMLRPMARSL